LLTKLWVFNNHLQRIARLAWFTLVDVIVWLPTPVPPCLQESLNAFEARNKNREPLVRIMGRIVLIDTKVSTLEENPYNLLPGSTYYVCYVEPLRLRGVKKRALALATSTPSLSTVGQVESNAASIAAAGASTGASAAPAVTGAEVGTEGQGQEQARKGLSLQHPTVMTPGGKEGGKVPPSGEKVSQLSLSLTSQAII
jgi:hypothetical protein